MSEPDKTQEALAQAERLLEQITPWPWRVEPEVPEVGAGGWGVEDIVAADGTHVVCFGHDYDDYGSMSSQADAEFIAAAPALVAMLREALVRSQAALARLRPYLEQRDATYITVLRSVLAGAIEEALGARNTGS
jgi:hypothetical protein